MSQTDMMREAHADRGVEQRFRRTLEMRWTATAILAALLLCFLAITPADLQAQGNEAGDPAGQTGEEAEEEEPEIRPYVEYGAGLSMVRNQNLCCATDRSGLSGQPARRFGGKFETEMPGYVVGGAIGARYRDFLRGELNLSWRSSDVDRMPVSSPPTPANGDIGLFAAMLNVYGDLDLDWGVIPYAGIGIGYGLISLDARNDDRTTPGSTSIDAQESVFVWNLMVGMSIPFSEVTEFTVGYRYLATTDPTYNARVIGVDPADPNNPDQRGHRFLDSEYDTHELTAGVRFNF